MKNINVLNSMLAAVAQTDDLVKEYKAICPKVLDGSTERDALDYCSGASIFVIKYLTGMDLYSSQMVFDRNQKVLDASTAPELLKRVQAPRTPCVGLLISQDSTGHECVFAGTGYQWAFYQANRSKAGENFTLAPRLNPHGRNWCANDMNDAQFTSFFLGLTQAANAGRLFSYRSPPVKWKLAAFSFQGGNLLA